ncbi:hypothetical protein [Methylomonas koyamae]|uniref:hypothetical protein n=1 Tax=Methylomonas koyamae TaxID=702114 RepID=UPI0011281001|nr:hypothetical protein [Methylomonas koyamae]
MFSYAFRRCREVVATAHIDNPQYVAYKSISRYVDIFAREGSKFRKRLAMIGSYQIFRMTIARPGVSSDGQGLALRIQ